MHIPTHTIPYHIYPLLQLPTEIHIWPTSPRFTVDKISVLILYSLDRYQDTHPKQTKQTPVGTCVQFNPVLDFSSSAIVFMILFQITGKEKGKGKGMRDREYSE